MKNSILILLFSTLICAHSEIVTLKTAWEASKEVTTRSKILTLKEGQVAKVLHFYCFDSGDPTTSGIRTSSDVNLKVNLDGLVVLYNSNTLHGSFSGGGAGFGEVGTSLLPPVFVGPATIVLTFEGSSFFSHGGACICTIEVEGTVTVNDQDSASDVAVTPDVSGPVDIILESSIDMQETWQTALPGTYGATAGKRFFRIRAEKK